MVAEGMAFGTGSAIAHRAIGSIFGGGGYYGEEGGAPRRPRAASAAPPADAGGGSLWGDEMDDIDDDGGGGGFFDGFDFDGDERGAGGDDDACCAWYQIRKFLSEISSSGDAAHPLTHASMAEAKERGNALYKAGKFVEAVAAYDESIGIDPTVASVHANRAAALSGQGRRFFGEAVKSCVAAVCLDPAYARARQRLGALAIKLGELDTATAAAEDALRADPESPGAIALVKQMARAPRRPRRGQRRVQSRRQTQGATHLHRRPGARRLRRRLRPRLRRRLGENPPASGPASGPASALRLP